MKIENVIELNNITVVLGEKKILEDISLTINRGDFVAILGPNGSGKSTLLHTILGLTKPKSGIIKVFGKKPGTGNSKIGYSPQTRPFDADIPITGRDYVGLGLIENRLLSSDKNRKKKIDNVLMQLDAQRLEDKKLGKMSGGEQQRISLGQALVSDPPLLLLDEPLANLDISYQSEILQRISDYHKHHNHTILLVSHDVNPLLPYINKVVYLANTHAKTGIPDEVIKEEVLTNLYGLPVKVFDIEGRVFVASFDGVIH